MDRRSFVAGVGSAVGALAGCISIEAGDDPVDRRAVWSRTVDGDDDPEYARGLAAAGGVVVANVANTTYAFDADGERRWADVLDHVGTVVGVAGGFVAVDYPEFHPRNSRNRPVLTRLRPDGTVEWAGESPPLVDLVVDPTGGDVVTATDPATGRTRLTATAVDSGRRRWSVELDDSPRSLHHAGGVVIVRFDGRLVARDAATGDPAWRLTGVPTRWPPAVADGHLYLTSPEAPYEVLVVDAATSDRSGDYVVASGLAPRERLAVGPSGVGVASGYDDGVHRTVAFDAATGDRRWDRRFDAEIAPSHSFETVFRDGSLYALDSGHDLRAIALADGAVQWSVPTGTNYPVVHEYEGALYLLAGRRLSALDA